MSSKIWFEPSGHCNSIDAAIRTVHIYAVENNGQRNLPLFDNQTIDAVGKTWIHLFLGTGILKIAVNRFVRQQRKDFFRCYEGKVGVRMHCTPCQSFFDGKGMVVIVTKSSI